MTVIYEVFTGVEEKVNKDLKALLQKAKLYGPEEFISVVELISELQFHTDPFLFRSVKDIQELYDKYRNNDDVEVPNYKLRYLMKLATYILYVLPITDPGYHTYNAINNELANILSSHNDVDPSYSCYDKYIKETIPGSLWVDLLKSNPWLVSVICLCFVEPRTLLESIDTLPAFYEQLPEERQ